MARYIAISLEYRNTLVRRFLQQVGHPLWAGLKQFKVLFKDARESCGELLAAPRHTSLLLRELNRLIQAGEIQTEFISESMRSIEELVLIQKREQAPAERIDMELVETAKAIVLQVNQLAEAQQAIYHDCPSFNVDLCSHESTIRLVLHQSEYDAIRMIITELLYNALKHARRGGRAELSLKREEGNAIVSVRDYGKGIPDAEIEQIFEEGFHSQALWAPEGMGFGLTFVRSVLQNLAWPLLTVQGKQPGVEFTLRIPLRR